MYIQQNDSFIAKSVFNETIKMWSLNTGGLNIQDQLCKNYRAMHGLYKQAVFM